MQKVWLITGATSGFGRALTEAAVARGDTVVAAARRPEALDDLVQKYPDQIDAVALDVTDIPAAEAAAADVLARHGRVDVLVNNAGRTHVGAVEETTDAELRALFDLHVLGPAALTRALLPFWRANPGGAVVQISSMGGQLSGPGFGAYSATKFALEGMSEALAAEGAPFGVRVLIVEPGSFRTGLFSVGGDSAALDAYADTVGATRAMVAHENGSQPGDPTKAAAAILTALEADKPPLRLALGADAVDAILAHSASVQADLQAWDAVSRATTFTEST